jgi:hypothetical protein
MSNSAMTPNELWRLLYAWRVAQIEGPKDDPDALRFEYLLKVACLKRDAKFLGQLARAFKKDAAPLVSLHLHVCARTLQDLITDPEALRPKALGLKGRERQKEIPRPWLPQDTLEKVRLAYVSFDPELHPTWEDVKELAIELYPELKPIRPRHWQRLRSRAGLSRLPSRGRGRPKKDKGIEAKNTTSKKN